MQSHDLAKARRFLAFRRYMQECGIGKDEQPFLKSQFDLLEEGVKDGRIHDAALVSYSRIEMSHTDES